jgi:hypothetical protein
MPRLLLLPQSLRLLKETVVEKSTVENMDVDPTQAVENQKQVREENEEPEGESHEPKKFKTPIWNYSRY